MARPGHWLKTRKELSCRAPGTIPVAGVERNDVLWADASRDGSAFAIESSCAYMHLISIPITNMMEVDVIYLHRPVFQSYIFFTHTTYSSLHRQELDSLHSTSTQPNAMTTSALGGSASLPRDQQIASCRWCQTRPGLSTSCPLKP
jgi:hypothetical protein